MTPFAIQCPKCKSELDARFFDQTTSVRCPGCTRPIEALLFPALTRPRNPGAAGELVLMEGESSCFYHPQKKAVLPCSSCGRFLCALCDCELNGEHFCPTCLETGQAKGKIRQLANRRPLYDSIALSLSILPLLVFYLTVVTAPMAIYLSIRHWNTPGSILRRTRFRFVIALALSTLQVGGWIVGIYYLTTHG